MSNHRKRMETYHNLLQMPERISRSLSSTRSGFIVNMYLVGLVIFGLFFLPLALAYWVLVVFPLRFPALVSVVIYAVYVAAIGGSLILYDAEVQRNRVELVTTFEIGFETPVVDVNFSANGAYLASATLYRIQVWDLDRLQLVAQIRAPEDYYFSQIRISPDGAQVASAHKPHTIFLWDVATGERLASLDCLEECQEISAFAFSPDGTMLVSSTDRTIPKMFHLWNFERYLAGISTDRASSDWVFSPDSAILAYSANRGVIQLWNIESGEIETTLQSDSDGPIKTPVFSPDGSLLAVKSQGAIEIWDLETERILTSQENASLRGMAFAADGLALAGLVTGDRALRLWDVHTGAIIAERKWSVDRVYCTAFSSDGTRLASGNWDGEIHLWSVPGLPATESPSE